MLPNLPTRWLITPELASLDGLAHFTARLARAFASPHDIRLVQLRNRSLDLDDYRRLVDAVVRLINTAAHRDVRLLLNPASAVADTLLASTDTLGAHGWHLTSHRLLASTSRPAGWTMVSAACHDVAQLAQAERLGVDFVTLSPVLPTATHPEATPLGWTAFAELAARANHARLPVFALGGMRADSLAQARTAGAWGIAAIRAFWPSEDDAA